MTWINAAYEVHFTPKNAHLVWLAQSLILTHKGH